MKRTVFAISLFVLGNSLALAADPIVHMTNGVPDQGTGIITTLGEVMNGSSLNDIKLAIGTPFQANSSISNTTFAATQSGTWTVQPGNVANTTAWKVDGSAVTQPVSLASVPSHPVTNAGTFAVQAAQSGTWNVRNLGNAGAITDFAGQNAASPANAWLMGGQFNTSPTTITSGNASPLQLDNAGNLLVNIKTGASSGAVAQGSTTSGQTGLLVQGAVTTAAPTYTTAQTSPLSLDTSGNLRVNVATITGQNANGQAVMASSAPIVIATDQHVSNASSSVAISVSTATTTQLVALSGSTSIYVTSFDVIAGGTGNITFEYGTGTACATGTTVLTGAYPLVAQAGISKGSGVGTILKVPSGNALCVLTSAAVQMSGSVSYQQF